ncbi:unnamed protein product, partial [Nippostrongylus brasiliensis]|uniref:Aspartyl aminopeptidase n=1 Tax=Nippostrongylus brasiliensis TaxID=27835 RepID=A0A0N4YT05_NIPBR
PAQPEVRREAHEFVKFLNKAVTPFHAVQECKERLLQAGFEQLPEAEEWDIKPLGKYFVTKNRSAIMAFAVGGGFVPGNGFSIVVGHTDSPCLRVKPVSKISNEKFNQDWNYAINSVCSGSYFISRNRSAIMAFAVGGGFVPGNGFSIVVGHTDSPCLRVKPVSKISNEKFNQVGVSAYGGGSWHTWFDRDLSVAGEVVFRAGGTLARRLIDIQHPILYIPNLAIHMVKDKEKFTYNKETHLRPILESFAAVDLNTKKDASTKSSDAEGKKDPRDITADHHTSFLDLIASAAHTTPDQVVDMDLYLYDANPARIGGIHDEFITGARLDNLVGTYTAIRGLIESLSDDRLLSDDHNVRVAVAFDNEECGSLSAMGAQSAFTEYVLRRICAGGDACSFERAIGRSILISADQAHASHPNYSDVAEANHRPTFHEGVVVKINVNQRYATTSTTHSVLKQIAAEANVPLQKVVVRNDSPCGTTVGPILASKLGLQTVDVGCPQLAMHSIREMIDTTSILQATRLYAVTFKHSSNYI